MDGPLRPQPLTRAGTLAARATILKLFDGYADREIAAMFEVPEGTIASWISHDRSTLRVVLKEER